MLNVWHFSSSVGIQGRGFYVILDAPEGQYISLFWLIMALVERSDPFPEGSCQNLNPGLEENHIRP